LFEELECPAIRLGGGLELAGQQSIEVINRAPETAEVIVQREHLGDQRRPDVEWRRVTTLFRVARRRAEHRFAFEFGVAGRWIGQARQQVLVQIRARADARPNLEVRQPSIERPRQLSRGRLRRHEDERVGRRVRIEGASKVEEVCAIPGQIGSAKEPGVPDVDLTRAKWLGSQTRVTESRVRHLRAGGSMAAS
jgi:hypothetical protein